MAYSFDDQKHWIPLEDLKNCPRCYIVYPPPPPVQILNEDSGPSLSPLAIAVISIVIGAFFFLCYCTIISKICNRSNSSSTLPIVQSEEFDDGPSPTDHAPWLIITRGLDESLIRSISICKYKKGDGLVEGTNCSVCLNEFKEEESLRLLPKCSHAFHIPCIDTWLKSHSNCPLCRANIVHSSPIPLQLPAPAPAPRNNSDSGFSSEIRRDDNTAVNMEDLERDVEEVTLGRILVSKAPFRALSDLGGLHGREYIIEIRDEGTQPVGRSVSMDSCRGPFSIANVLRTGTDEDFPEKDRRFLASVGSSKRIWEEGSKSHGRSRVLHCVTSPISKKRSPSGRFTFTRHGRGKNSIIPI
eukprot:TRINITY_DN17321_c0_g1_i1.p1 TRINITY_DN17321_c0_g1~~TRINITY_DN17321_c0_g1_i1.p1  ORF type:complete len:356 (+),score=31.61 TRINITY_DN17321_c0_g1_i1:114-1181(+)